MQYLEETFTDGDKKSKMVEILKWLLQILNG